jgi:NAD(P)-dependent dehydrogenase (short-subunit alcohol dehydrogenase family)
VEVLVTGGDTELGRTVAEGFRDDGHKVTLVGAHRSDLEIAAKELDVDAVACDTTDPASLDEVRELFPHHLDTIVNVPAPSWSAGDPRTYSIADTANAWRKGLDTTVLSLVLTVQTVGDHLRSGGSIISVVTENPPAGSADAAIKAALSSWIAGQASVFGIRGITVNAVASGRSAQSGYEGLSRTPPPAAAEVARLALFLTTPAARHITGQTLHVSRGALAHFG